MRTPLACLALSLIAAPVQAASIDAALSAYRQTRVAEAETGYRAVLADPAASADDRATAARELARVAWLIDGNAALAKTRLAEAEAAGGNVCDTAELEARVLREAGERALAASEGRRLVGRCDDPLEADAVRQQVLEALLGDAQASAGERRDQLLTDAEAEVAAFSADGRADLDANRSAMLIAVMRRDAAGLTAAWRRYFWLVDRKAPQALAAYEATLDHTFAAGLAADAPAADQLAMLEVLVRAGFDRAARQLAADSDLATRAGDDARWTHAQAYFRFRDGIAEASLTANRGMARKLKPAKPYQAEVLRLAGELTGEDKPQAIKDALERDFGMYGAVGETSGYPSLHLGHVIEDMRRPVEDAGRKGEVRFIAIDNVVANGFESWLWDGWAAAGGWAEDGATIIQIRPRYALGPVRALGMVGDTPARRRVLREIAAHEPRDRAAGAGGAILPMPSVELRLSLQTVDAVAEKARAKAGAGGDFRQAFLSEYWRMSVEHSIFQHEGRHVLDQAAAKAADRKARSDDLEFTAKLSELRLAEIPRMALENIDDDLVGADTPHGRGNAKVVKGLRDWLEIHKGEVARYDPAVPALAQLDKLSDAQIRVAATGMDPWFAKAR